MIWRVHRRGNPEMMPRLLTWTRKLTLLPFTDSENTGGAARVGGKTLSLRGPWDICKGPSSCWLEITSLFITKPWEWMHHPSGAERRKGKKKGGMRRTKNERIKGRRGSRGNI